MYQFKLPDVGEGIHEAEIVRWLVEPGDSLSLNQPMLEIQNDKSIVEIPAPIAGTVSQIKAKPGQTVYVGDLLITIDPRPAPQTAAAPAPTPTALSQTDPPQQRVLAAPAVRRMAREQNINLADVPGSGPVGRILPSDVRGYLEAQQAAETEAFQAGSQTGVWEPAKTSQPIDDSLEADLFADWSLEDNFESAEPTEAADLSPAQSPTKTRTWDPNEEVPFADPTPQPSSQTGVWELGEAGEPDDPAEAVPPPAGRYDLSPLRRTIARRLSQAWREIPHITALDQVEVKRLVKLRQQLQPQAEMRGVRLTYLPFIIKALSLTLREFPDFNASLDMAAGQVIRHPELHLGIATATPHGLLVPVIHQADNLNLLDLAQTIEQMTQQAQTQSLPPDQLRGSSFTLTNFGSVGLQQGTPIINPPEVAILGCGRISKQPVVHKGKLAARPVLPLALSVDHRLLDGAAAGAFLTRLKALLHRPKLMLLDLR